MASDEIEGLEFKILVDAGLIKHQLAEYQFTPQPTHSGELITAQGHDVIGFNMRTRMTLIKTRVCIVCGRRGELEVRPVGYTRWLAGEPIQEAMPELTPGEREQLVSGIDDACWHDLYPPDEEDYTEYERS